jgi:hypothetical protein
MMMIVSDPILVASGGTSGLDAAKEALLGERPQRVVHGLTRNRADLGADFLGHGVSSAMRVARDGSKDRQTLSSHLQPMLSEKAL